MERISSFAPIVGDEPSILILGSMPSIKSLEREEYYGHGRNQFWMIMGDLFGFDCSAPYEERVERVKARGIAIWDVFESCERKGSLDKDIKAQRMNDLDGFVGNYPSLKAIVLNGGKARDVFYRAFKDGLPDVEILAMGSTSPAYTLAYEKKLAQWRRIMDYLKNE